MTKINKYRVTSIKYVITIACIIVSIIPMIYSGISIYTTYSKELIENSNIYTEQIMHQLKINVDEYLSQTIKTTNDINAIVEQNDYIFDSQLETTVNNYYSTRNDIVSISFFNMNGELMSSTPKLITKPKYNILNEIWFEDVSNKKILYYITEPHVQNAFFNQRNWVISISKLLEFDEGRTKNKVILVVDISIQALKELCNNLNLGGNGYVYIKDFSNNILYHPQQALIFDGYKEEKDFIVNNKNNTVLNNSSGEKILINKQVLSFVNWTVVGVTYINNNANDNKKIIKQMVSTIPIILFIIILLALYISGKISMPIMKLEKGMKKVQEGNFDTQINIVKGEKEVIELANSFNIMMKKIKDLIEENKLEQEAKRKSEFEVLQSQINPHFLYNTLDSISWMAESGNNDAVVEMITALARLFRVSISKGKTIITVDEELEHEKNYKLIQKVRDKDKFEYEILASEEVKKLKTPKLILQPLIENSLYHGIEYMVDEGYIKIKADIEDEMLVYKIEDNGLGMSDEQIKKIFDIVENNSSKKRGSGVGVRNINERIKLMYGNNYGLKIQSKLEEGTILTIELPIIRGEQLE